MERRNFILSTGSLGALLLGSNSATATSTDDDQSPYAGQQTRKYSALSEEDVAALKAGKGAVFGGLAKPAELNGYPGPRHVLDLSDELNLIDKQKDETKCLSEEMQSEARILGREYLNVERQIDSGSSRQSSVVSTSTSVSHSSGRWGERSPGSSSADSDATLCPDGWTTSGDGEFLGCSNS